ncbi:MAG: YciI family protein [Pseudomonadota bacterium]
MPSQWIRGAMCTTALLVCGASLAQGVAEPAQPAYDAELAKQLAADDRGMRKYVLVVLKTGPNKVPAGSERDEMFKGHFANMGRLASEKKLAIAGPLDGVDGWRGLFIFAVEEIEEARALVATDPVIIKGEMVAEFHKYYGSAGLMLVNDTHKKLAKKSN